MKRPDVSRLSDEYPGKLVKKGVDCCVENSYNKIYDKNGRTYRNMKNRKLTGIIAGVMLAAMVMTGCSGKGLDGSATVATVGERRRFLWA